MKSLLFLIVFYINIIGDGLSGIDFGSQNVVVGAVGGKSNFEVITSESGKRTSPAVVGIYGLRIYA
jgi:molecular chaperone DnaK (HSP70)